MGTVFIKTLHELGNGDYAYVQHDGSWAGATPGW